MSKTKLLGVFLKYAVLIAAAIGILGAVFFLGGKEGFQYGYHKAVATMRAAVQQSQYPLVKVVFPSKEAIAIIRGGICVPILPTHKIPEFAHIEYVSPEDRPCGPGKPGQPFVDSAALAALTRAVQK